MRNETEKNRIIWVDNVKVIAIVLVVLGHLFQGIGTAGIIKFTAPISFFEAFIYTFHVPLFFICSGFLYQKTTVVNSLQSYKNNALKKITALGIPYLIFSTISYLLKTIFADNVNAQANGFLKTIFISPDAPFWFLYTLLIIFLITPTAKNKKSAGVIFSVSVIFIITVLSTLSYIPNSQIYIHFVYTTSLYLVWFALGILIAEIKIEKLFSPFWSISFIAAGILTYLCINNGFANHYLFKYASGLLACFGVIGVTGWICRKNKQTPLLGFISKYTMPIFLMHTIFAAGIRAVLLKINITNSAVHITAGIIASFIMPIIAQIIMDKIHLDILIYPLKYISGRKQTSRFRKQ